jgi:hypothetical protein
MEIMGFIDISVMRISFLDIKIRILILTVNKTNSGILVLNIKTIKLVLYFEISHKLSLIWNAALFYNFDYFETIATWNLSKT